MGKLRTFLAFVLLAQAWHAGAGEVPAAQAQPWKPVEQDVAAVLAAARPLQAENVAVPVKSVREGLLHWVPNPDGKSWDLVQVYFKEYGGPNSIVVMDLGSGEIKVENHPRELNWHLSPAVLAPDGKLYLSVLKGMHVEICVYDPGANTMKLKAVPVPETLRGETHPLVLGTDGMLYAAGAHPSRAASAVQIDPASGKVTDYGAIGPSHAPNDCWGYSAAADETHVYIASGKIPWYLVALEKKSGKSEVLAQTGTVGGYVSVGQGPDGCTASVSQDDKRTDYWLFQGRAIPKAEPCPWKPAPKPAAPAAPPKPELYTENVTPHADGRCEMWVKADVPGAQHDPPQPGWSILRYEVPTYPMTSHRLVELPNGRLLGSAGAYEGNYLYDPQAGRCEHLGKIALSHYATAIAGDKVYMSGYPTSPLYGYDITRPWTAVVGGKGPGTKVLPEDAPGSNPRLLCRLTEAGTHKMYAAAVGASGKVYFGGRWYRNGSCGGVAWWDPEKQKHFGFWRELSNYQVNFMTAAGSGRYIVISTHRVEDSVLNKPKPKQGKLFIFDDAAGKIVREIEPVAEAKGAGLVICAGGARVLGWTENPKDEKSSILYGADCESGEVLWTKTLPVALPVSIGSNQMEAFDYRLGPDGRVWTFMKDVLVRIEPREVSVKAVGRISPGGRLAFAGPDVYLAGTENLRRVPGIAAEGK